MAEICYSIKGIREETKQKICSGEFINTSIAEKCDYIMLNHQSFQIFSYEYIADCIVNIGSCLREKSSNIKVFVCVLIPRDESWSVNRVSSEKVDRILEHLCLKYDVSSSHWRDIRNWSLYITKKQCFSYNTGKRYSYSNTCKNKASVSFALTLNEADFPPLSPPINAHKCKHSTSSNNCNHALSETHDSDNVSSTNKPVSIKIVCKPTRIASCNKPVIFSPVQVFSR